MVDAIPLKDFIKELAEHPLTAATAATSLTVGGAVNRFLDNLPYLHELLSDISMLVGIVSVIMLIRIQYLKGNRESMQNDVFREIGESIKKRRKTDRKEDES